MRAHPRRHAKHASANVAQKCQKVALSIPKTCACARVRVRVGKMYPPPRYASVQGMPRARARARAYAVRVKMRARARAQRPPAFSLLCPSKWHEVRWSARKCAVRVKRVRVRACRGEAGRKCVVTMTRCAANASPKHDGARVTPQKHAARAARKMKDDESAQTNNSTQKINEQHEYITGRQKEQRCMFEECAASRGVQRARQRSMMNDRQQRKMREKEKKICDKKKG